MDVVRIKLVLQEHSLDVVQEQVVGLEHSIHGIENVLPDAHVTVSVMTAPVLAIHVVALERVAVMVLHAQPILVAVVTEHAMMVDAVVPQLLRHADV